MKYLLVFLLPIVLLMMLIRFAGNAHHNQFVASLEAIVPAKKVPSKIQKGKSYRVIKSGIAVFDLGDRGAAMEVTGEEILIGALAKLYAVVNAGETVKVFDLDEGYMTGLWVRVRVTKINKGLAETLKVWETHDKRGLIWIKASALE